MENVLNAECTHSNYPTKTMTLSWLDGRVKLVADWKSSIVSAIIDGDVKVIEKDCTIAMFERLEKQCEDVAMDLMSKEGVA